MKPALLFLTLILITSSCVEAFSPFPPLSQSSISTISTSLADGSGEPSDMVARRIIVTGDVHGGYYRSCVKNEVSISSSFHG